MGGGGGPGTPEPRSLWPTAAIVSIVVAALVACVDVSATPSAAAAAAAIGFGRFRRGGDWCVAGGLYFPDKIRPLITASTSLCVVSGTPVSLNTVSSASSTDEMLAMSPAVTVHIRKFASE